MTTAEINDQIIAQLEAELNQKIPLLPKAFLRVIAKVLAGATTLLYKYGNFILLQMFVRTATDQSVTVGTRTLIPLNEWGELVGIGQPTPATQAEMNVQFTDLTSGFSVLPAGTLVQHAGSGVTYTLVNATQILAGAPLSSIGLVRASSDVSGGDGSGTIGNLSVGAALTIINPPSFVSRDCTVASVIITAADQEASEVYRQRTLDRFQKRPQGGAALDYELWGEEVAGIINVYPYRFGVAGFVQVFCEATPESSGSADGIPAQSQLMAVQAAIDLDLIGLASRRPIGSSVFVQAITRTGFSVTVTGLQVSTDSLASVRAQIIEEIERYYLDREPFIPGLTPLPRKDEITKNALVGLVDDIVSAQGGSFTTVNFSLGSGNLTLYTLGAGEKAKASSVSVP